MAKFNLEVALESAKGKIVEQLEAWCVSYETNIIYTSTPRYSQVMRTGISFDGEFVLRSTVGGGRMKLDLTEDEIHALDITDDNQELWDWWKAVRTEYLTANHPTIKAY
jgi:hypothetical protein